jgi:hypothetical protein
MIQEFSKAYYVLSCWITRNNQDKIIVHPSEYQSISEKGYDEKPIIIKIGNGHFEVTDKSSVPTKTLSIDKNILRESSIDRVPSKSSVLLTKPEFTDVLKYYTI